jgi:hypothetical protein
MSYPSSKKAIFCKKTETNDFILFIVYWSKLRRTQDSPHNKACLRYLVSFSLLLTEQRILATFCETFFYGNWPYLNQRATFFKIMTKNKGQRKNITLRRHMSWSKPYRVELHSRYGPDIYPKHFVKIKMIGEVQRKHITSPTHYSQV